MEVKLAEGQARLEKSQARMMDKLTVVSDRLDDFARAVIRSFTKQRGLQRM